MPTPWLPKHLDGFWAPFLYQDTARDLILQFKFADKTELAPVLSPFLVEQFQYLPSTLTNPLIVPIPLHPHRLRKRLFNQAALLAQYIAKQTNTPYDTINALKKIKNHKPQAQKTAIGRQKLPLNTFKHHKTPLKNRDIILIDDIFTTGSTLNAAAAQLKKSGASKVYAITLAYTPLK